MPAEVSFATVSSPPSARRARVAQPVLVRARPVTMVFGPGEAHRALPLSVADLVDIRDEVARLGPDDIDRLVASWTIALVHLPPARPLDSLIPFVVADLPLAHTEMSRRARNGLNRAGWWTLREAAAATLSEVSSARHVGPSSLTEFVSAYVRHALTADPLVAAAAPAQGVFITWFAEVLADAQQRGITEIDVHVVERAPNGPSDRESLLGLPLSQVTSELAEFRLTQKAAQ